MLLFRMFMPFVLLATIISIVVGIVVMSGGGSHHQDDTASLCKTGLELSLKAQYLPALGDFDKALLLDRKCAAAYVGRAQILNVLGDFIGAADNCNQAIALDPTFAAAYANRCASFYWLGQFQKSMDDALTCQKLNDSRFPKGVTFMALAVGQTGLKQFPEALNNANQAVALLPKAPTPYSVRARIELEQKQYEQAVADCNTSLSLFARSAHVYETRALAYDGLGKTEPAAADRKQSKTIMDQNSAVLAEYKRTFH